MAENIPNNSTEDAQPAELVNVTEVAGAWKNPNTHAYISRITGQRESNLFLEEYYSSTDTKIYFDDVEQTEIGYIQYLLQEQLKPIYGYSSNTWDDVAIGNRIVTGILKVPIRNIDVRAYGEELENPSLDTIIAYHGVKKYFSPEDHNQSEEENLENLDWIDKKRQEGYAEEEDKKENNNDSNNKSEYDKFLEEEQKKEEQEKEEKDTSRIIKEGNKDIYPVAYNYLEKLKYLGYDVELGKTTINQLEDIMQEVGNKFALEFYKEGYIIPENNIHKSGYHQAAVDYYFDQKMGKNKIVKIPADWSVRATPDSNNNKDGYYLPEETLFYLVEGTKTSHVSVKEEDNTKWYMYKVLPVYPFSDKAIAQSTEDPMEPILIPRLTYGYISLIDSKSIEDYIYEPANDKTIEDYVGDYLYKPKN